MEHTAQKQHTPAPAAVRFFSIMIPAHNEEALIEETLSHLKDLRYPKDKYEVIVVENGSSDATYEKAKKFASGNFKIYTTRDKGVSKARNFGISKCSENMEWCIIMDADTLLKSDFLIELNAFLNKKPHVHHGTTTILPFPSTFTSRAWFWYRNWSDRLIKMMHVIHIVKKEHVHKEKYDEELTLTEDLHYSRKLLKHGRYFFLRTKNVHTSARRFEREGYLKMFFVNLFYGALPKKINKHNDWKVIR